eukprot:4164128-Pyramimonas_sp.AAC.1
MSARAAVRPIKATVAPRLSLPLRAKLLYTEAFGSSRCFYASCLWRPMPQAVQSRVRCCREFLYRCALGLPASNSPEHHLSYWD